MADHFEFQPQKSLAVTSYFALKTCETMYMILKMVYLADRLHLERYGRPITGDRFVALKEGACPSRIYDSMKVLRGEPTINYLPESEKYLEVDPTTFEVSLKDMPSLDVLSASDVECLDEVIAVLKRQDRWAIRDMAHDEAWKKTGRNKTMEFGAIAGTLENGEVLAKHIETRFSI